MSDELFQPGSRADWQQALDALERGLRQSLDALMVLRGRMDVGSVPRRPAVEEEDDEPAYTAGLAEEPGEIEVRQPVTAEPRRSPFERLWDRLEEERQSEEQDATQPQRKGLAALPAQYFFTIEDMEGRADLVALHRGFLGLREVRDVSLMSFVNGVPIVSVNAERELDLAQLSEAIGEATDRECDIVTQDGPKVHVRLRAREERAA